MTRLPRTIAGAALWAALCVLAPLGSAGAAERVAVAVGDAPTLGPATAPVTVIEFVDFQ